MVFRSTSQSIFENLALEDWLANCRTYFILFIF